MAILVFGLLLFFLIHSVSVINHSWRDQFVQKYGEMAWKGVYALISIAGFTMIIQGYAEARMEPTVIYNSAPWLRHLAMLVMLPVFPLLLATYFPGRIKTAAKHPMLAAVKLWALSHLLVNGFLTDVLLFGSFLAWAVLVRISMKHRQARPIPSAPVTAANDIIVVVTGIGLYVAFILVLHTAVIGVSPLGS